MKKYLNWTVGLTKSPDVEPTEFVPATVPGAVQLDWARAHGWPDHNVGDNWRDYAWMEDVYWLYRAKLPAVNLAGNQRLIFTSKGIDYRFEIRLGGERLKEQEGMFRPVACDITEKYAAGSLLEVLVWPAPKSVDSPADRVQANRSCKPAVSYGWDFHPRLIPLGIWDETFIEALPKLRVEHAEVTCRLSDDYKTADLTLRAGFTGLVAFTPKTIASWSLLDPDGAVVFDLNGAAQLSAMRWSRTIDSPRLWWPHAEGEQPLYTSRFALTDESGFVISEITQRIGFKRARLVMHPTAWDGPVDFPKSRSDPPITLEINGRQIFAKGSNWVNPSIFPGEITRETYAQLLGLFKAANLSIVRCWGGAIVNKDEFFDLCDELGIMVWQEFPLACNAYPDDQRYLDVLDEESRAIIQGNAANTANDFSVVGNE